MSFDAIRLEEKQQAFAELREVKTIFAERGWFPGTSGNLSIRTGEFSPDQFAFAITSSGKDKSVHTPSDYLLVDQNGKPMEATGLKPSAETLIHCEIYRATGCGAIFHVHTVFNNLVSELYGEHGSVPVDGVELIKRSTFGKRKRKSKFRFCQLRRHSEHCQACKRSDCPPYSRYPAA